MLGNHTRGVLDHTALPVLVIPEGARFEKLHKIVFATDLNMDDLNVIQSLASLAWHGKHTYIVQNLWMAAVIPAVRNESYGLESGRS